MAFMLDKQELKPGLVIFRRSDVKHRKWYCRLKVPNADRYKTISLDTENAHDARNLAFDEDAELRFKIKHDMPVFDRTFAEVAKEYADFQKQRADAGEITRKRSDVEDGYIRTQLNPYAGHLPITHIAESHWKAYPLWRRGNGKGRKTDKVSDWTIRSEMATFRSIMLFAAEKKRIASVPKMSIKALKLGKPRGEGFTPEEYRKLYTHAREWVKKGRGRKVTWYREMFQNFMLCMTNTGLRPPEARNFRRRDIGEPRKGADGRPFLPLRVRGKNKFRELVAPMTVATYLDRVLKLVDERLRALGREPGPDDFVFMNYEGNPAETLYASLLDDLLSKEETNLLISASDKRRSIYSFRHTYATFRLMNGTDVYFLAKQMGTSVQMIEDYYGHITPGKNADAILQGIPGWESAPEASGETDDGLKADGDGSKKAAKPRRKRG